MSLRSEPGELLFGMIYLPEDRRGEIIIHRADPVIWMQADFAWDLVAKHVRGTLHPSVTLTFPDLPWAASLIMFRLIKIAAKNRTVIYRNCPDRFDVSSDRYVFEWPD